MKNTYFASAVLFGWGASALAQTPYPFQDAKLPTEQRITNILSLMTLDEKIAALGTNSGVQRLQIPNAGSSEGLHGLVQRGGFGPVRQEVIPTTQFAQVVGMGQTWNRDLVEAAGAIQGKEARWIYNNSAKYKRFPLVVWGPNADLARDPRWGRIDESYGEDAFLTGTLAAAFIRGLQGRDPRYWQAASLVKHFMANSNENGRYGSSSDFDARQMHEYYSASFRIAFVDGGARSYMASYNAWNRVPMTIHPMLTDVVAHEWGVDGIVSTDAGAVTNMVTKHKYFASQEEAVAACIRIGVNQFLDRYQDDLRAALTEKLVTEADVDAALRGKFRTVIKLGLLDPPSMVAYTANASDEEPWQSVAHKAVALQVARESIVLLKNEGRLLPLRRDNLKSLAVFGPRANSVMLGLYSGEPPYRVSPIDGIRKAAGSDIKVTTGGFFLGDPAAVAKAADVAIVVAGNDPTCNRLSVIAGFGLDDSWCETPSDGMENSDRRSLTLQDEALVKQIQAANPRTILVLMADFPYAISWSKQNLPAILTMSQNAQEAGTALADVLFGNYNPAGRLVVTWPKSLEQLPPMLDYDLRHGRTYMYFKDEPLFAFGHGLSYTTFSYSGLRPSASRVPPEGEIAVSVDVKNTGDRPGDEVVQLYVRHEGSKVERPKKELRAFQRVTLGAGEVKTVQLKLRAASLAYWDEKAGRFVVEDEPIRLMVGGSSSDVRLETTVTVSRPKS
jgi:beta-glucosidase